MPVCIILFVYMYTTIYINIFKWVFAVEMMTEKFYWNVREKDHQAKPLCPWPLG